MGNKIINAVKGYRVHYKNYIYVLLGVLRRRRKINAILRNSDERKVIPWELAYAYSASRNVSDFNYADEEFSFLYKGKSISLHLGRSSDPYAVFFEEDYKFLDVKGRIIIDIGMNIGDSSIYFAINGAIKVIGLEPYPYTFNLAERNVDDNKLGNVIELLNCGYGKDGDIIVDDTYVSTSASKLVSSAKGARIKILSLKTLLSRYEITEAYLKMDCEGCEYNLLNEENMTLKHFVKILIEYHYGIDGLKEKLEDAGFMVKATEAKKMVLTEGLSKRELYVGYIYAKRK